MDYFKTRRTTLEEILQKTMVKRDLMLEKALLQKENLKIMLQAKQEAYDHMSRQLNLMAESYNKKIVE